MPALFSYGTLQQESVQLANFGRVLVGEKTQLSGYRVGSVKITDARVIRESGKDVHPILEYTGDHSDRVHGTVFEITDAELARADDYEVDDYVRVEATLTNGKRCWIYASARDQSV